MLVLIQFGYIFLFTLVVATNLDHNNKKAFQYDQFSVGYLFSIL